MYTLFYSPGSASLAVHQTLLELDVPYAARLVDFSLDAQHQPDYLALNPAGVVPTLLIEGQAYVESAALLQLLTERHPDKHLAPAIGSPLRAQWLQWVTYLSTTLGASYRVWFYPETIGLAELPEPMRLAQLAGFARIFDRLDAHLAAAGPYLLGETFSVADLQLMMYLRWSRNMPKPATDWPALQRFAQRMRQRPSWLKVHELENLPLW